MTLRALPFLLPILLASCASSTEDHVEDFCALEYECYPEIWDSEAACVSEFSDKVNINPDDIVGGQDCVDAEKELVQCLSRIKDCTELEAYWEEPTADYPCNEEQAQVTDYCIEIYD